MSNPTHPRHARRARIALSVGAILLCLPAAAQAAPVDLATASSFVVLGGQTVTNVGPSVLNGDLGVAPGTALTGFGAPAVVNGATHANDAVANQAQADLTTAYDVAAAQPVSPANDLTGENLGNRTLAAGAYRSTSSAQLTGALVLDAAGDPNAQFVFEIASALTTAPASSVVLINGASPCNVFWQVGSSATLDTTTAFQGNLMALTSISLNNGASVIGRVLARNGQVSLINNVLDGAGCGAGTTAPSSSGSTSTAPAATSPAPAMRAQAPRPRGTASLRRPALRRPRNAAPCTAGFTARVRGAMIRRVVFSLVGSRLRSVSSSPFEAYVRAAAGAHTVTARVTFRDATRARTLRLRYRACAAAVRRPAPGPSRFTG